MGLVLSTYRSLTWHRGGGRRDNDTAIRVKVSLSGVNLLYACEKRAISGTRDAKKKKKKIQVKVTDFFFFFLMYVMLSFIVVVVLF